MGSPYNGWSWDERCAVIPVQNEHLKEHPHTLDSCVVCGQTEGRILAHLEDYDDPVDGIYPLCFLCHMMVHCRFRAPKAWAWYREQISEGAIFARANSFGEVQQYLRLQRHPLAHGRPRGKTFLDTLC